MPAKQSYYSDSVHCLVTLLTALLSRPKIRICSFYHYTASELCKMYYSCPPEGGMVLV